MQSNVDFINPYDNLQKSQEEIKKQSFTISNHQISLESCSISKKEIFLPKSPYESFNKRNSQDVAQLSQIQIKSKKKQDYHLPSLYRSSLSNYPTLQNPQTSNNKFNKNTIQSKKSIAKNQKLAFKPSKSVQIRKEKPVDQSYLPSFIRNFKLPQKKKVQIRPTMDIYKKRQNLMKKFAISIEQLKNYRILSHIGKGSFSIVSLALNIQNNKKYAIKTYNKFDKIQDYKFDGIQKQIQNMNKLKSHLNVIRIQSIILDQRKILLIMENGGQQSLAGLLRKKKHLTQNLAKLYFKQIIQGMQYCHKNSICHRDLKLQNILIDQNECIKIIDFGFSANSDRMLNSFCGTPPYMAPEIVMKSLYDGKKTDIWALGIILYVMLYGDFPFKSVHEKQLFRLIQQGKYNHNQTISKQAKQVIDKMLKPNIGERPSAEQILEMKWLRN